MVLEKTPLRIFCEKEKVLASPFICKCLPLKKTINVKIIHNKSNNYIRKVQRFPKKTLFLQDISAFAKSSCPT